MKTASPDAASCSNKNYLQSFPRVAAVAAPFHTSCQEHANKNTPTAVGDVNALDALAPIQEGYGSQPDTGDSTEDVQKLAKYILHKNPLVWRLNVVHTCCSGIGASRELMSKVNLNNKISGWYTGS